MSSDLINFDKTDVGGRLVQTIDARHIHENLESGKDFSSWIKKKIVKHNLVENTDYWVFPQMGELGISSKIQKRIDYALAIRPAMMIAAGEGTKKGRQVLARLVDTLVTSQERALAEADRVKVVIQNREIESLTLRVKEQEALHHEQAAVIAAQVKAIRKLTVNNKAMKSTLANPFFSEDKAKTEPIDIMIDDMAKMIRLRTGYQIDAYRLFTWLFRQNYIRGESPQHFIPVKKAVKSGLFVKVDNHLDYISPKTLFTPFGQEYFVEIFNGLGSDGPESDLRLVK